MNCEMSLYIRLSTNFYSHVKTLRLRAAIGDNAFWVPPRLWVYAAEHQPDGDLSKYSPEEIAMLIGYSGDAQALLEALLRSGFLDGSPTRIHGWDEHNGFHKTFAERASKAAKARWATKKQVVKPPLNKGKDKRRDEMRQALLNSLSSIACSIPSSIRTEAFVDAWVMWIFDRKDRKKSVTENAKGLQLQKLSEMGEAKAIESIHLSIEKGWTGLFEPKNQSENEVVRNAI